VSGFFTARPGLEALAHPGFRLDANIGASTTRLCSLRTGSRARRQQGRAPLAVVDEGL
jgi:hypothetical protein